jgi:hypothetical protein
MKIKPFQNLSTLFFIILVLMIFLPFYLLIKINPNDLPPIPEKGGDVVARDTILNRCPAHVCTLRWRDYSGRRYESSFVICNEDAKKAAQNRASTNFSIFPTVYDYQNLVNYDKTFLIPIKKQLDSLAAQYTLSSKEKLEMVVTMVQSIRYALVHPQSCQQIRAAQTANPNPNDFIYQWHFNTPPYTPENGARYNPCEENIEKYGVLSPLEFLYEMQGDCDSRTTFLFALLSEMGYKVAILNSDTQHHSILGVQLRELDGVRYQEGWYGAQYIVWETTARLNAGIFPDFKNSDWKIVLKN